MSSYQRKPGIILMLILMSFFVVPLNSQKQSYNPTNFDVNKEYSEAISLFNIKDYNAATTKLQLINKYLKDTGNVLKLVYIYRDTNILLGIIYFRKGILPTSKAIFQDVFQRFPNLTVDNSILSNDVAVFIDEIKREISDREIVQRKSKIEKREEAQSNRVSASAQNSTSAPIIEVIKIKVIKTGAVLRLDPDENSLVVKEIPLGALLSAKEILDNWVKVELLPNEEGIVIVGYINVDFVRLEK